MCSPPDAGRWTQGLWGDVGRASQVGRHCQGKGFVVGPGLVCLRTRGDLGGRFSIWE